MNTMIVPRPVRSLVIAVVFAALALRLASCSTEARREATVSGKTVYRGMGMEGVGIEVFRWEVNAWIAQPPVRSGYHGSFRVRLPPGRYFLRAVSALPSAPRPGTNLSGAVQLQVAGLRLDRVVLEMRAARDSADKGPRRATSPTLTRVKAARFPIGQTAA